MALLFFRFVYSKTAESLKQIEEEEEEHNREDALLENWNKYKYIFYKLKNVLYYLKCYYNLINKYMNLKLKYLSMFLKHHTKKQTKKDARR